MTTTSSANITNELILEEIKKSKQELKASIEAVEEVNRRINALEQKNKNLEDKLENIERTQRKNNIIIFGMQNVQQVTPEIICDELKKEIDINLNISDFNNVYPLGKQENSPLKIEFLSYLKKTTVKHLYLAKEDKNKNCYIKNNKLYVNGEAYSTEQLQIIENIDDDPVKSNSEPGTPSAQTHNKEEKKKEEKGRILKPTNLLKTKVSTQSSSTPIENKSEKKEITKQTERQTDYDKRKTRSGSTSSSSSVK
ncbi:hypothetical protein NQ318_015615 [Aromia moschata]|uniref:Uncharacterized protein n=1 Tax=Aromia moschata TaxID=1265417 RepID=A0AAV8X9K3_9CUCU|nr:hypothetical protein NQ318_015615 [Aromia moschata]